VTIAFAFVRRDVWALVIGVIAGHAVGSIASYGLVRRMPRVVLSRHRIYELLQFGRFVSGSRALMYFSVNFDAAVVGVTMGTHDLGVYQFATRVAELPVVTFTRAVGQVALPALSGLEAGAATLRRAARTLFAWVLAVNTGAALLIVLLGERAVDAVAGPQWVEAVPVMRVLAVAMVCRAVIVLAGQLLDGAARPALTMRLNAVRLAALLVVLPVLGAWRGIAGVAQGVLLANAGAALFAVHLSAGVLSPRRTARDAD
jgi:lipopolysaccharide exporter